VNTRQRLFNRWVIILVALAVIASLAATIPWGTSDKKHSTLPTPVPTAGLEGSGAQLATLLTSARKHTFHARYAVRGDKALIGGTLSLEWWNKNGHSRVDTTRTSGSDVVRTASLVNGSDGASCQQIGSGAWSCSKISVPNPGDPSGIIASVTSQLAGRPVTQSNAKVGGRSALCFHVGGGTEPIDVCTNSDGVLLRNSSSQVTYELTTLETTVSDSIFTPPATVR